MQEAHILRSPISTQKKIYLIIFVRKETHSSRTMACRESTNRFKRIQTAFTVFLTTTPTSATMILTNANAIVLNFRRRRNLSRTKVRTRTNRACAHQTNCFDSSSDSAIKNFIFVYDSHNWPMIVCDHESSANKYMQNVYSFFFVSWFLRQTKSIITFIPKYCFTHHRNVFYLSLFDLAEDKSSKFFFLYFFGRLFFFLLSFIGCSDSIFN